MKKAIPTFRRAERAKVKLRLGIGGPSGSGKTYSSLLIASGLGKKIAVIDTEHSSAELYSDLFEYDVATLTPPFTPQKYIDMIHEAEDLGYDVIIIDSLSHAWRGEGGMMDIHDSVTQATGNSFAAWREVSPMHNKLVETLLQSPAHIITTLRAKQDYVIIEEDGKKSVRKVGLAPVFRDGIEYEFTMYFEMTADHLAVVSKDRTGLFGNNPPFIPTKQTGETIREWLESGADRPNVSQDEIVYNAIASEIDNMVATAVTKAELFSWFEKHKNEIEMLPSLYRNAVYTKLKEAKNQVTAKTAAKAAEKIEVLATEGN